MHILFHTNNDAAQVPYPQVVLLGDSLFQFSVETDNGFSFEAALQSSEDSIPKK